jgi:phosphoglycerate dehydrogenase-like enzyme
LEKKDLHGFLGQGIDWLVVCVPLTEKTRGFLGKEEFAVLRDGLVTRSEAECCGVEGVSFGRKTFVTNIARGPIIDQEALIGALKDGTLQGAALDVTDPEPLPADSELWDLENVVVTPHISGNGVAYEDRAFQVLGVNLERREKGERLINVVKRERGY